ncbi:MAG: glycerol-3-phosphate dehydrogenase [Alphaproteobacteria bacterium]|nr:MAG: glycerol-3-phosphate dehydrogenase [Alphaproteobacteria bacterium]
MSDIADLFVIGGGINGAGIARDAAGRGLKVALCEQRDFAAATSSASSKLVHGGLRYLEYYEFRLVRESLIEREVLLRAAPHIIWPLRFVLPHHKGLRPAWMLRLGLFLYDHLGGRKLLPGTQSLNLRRHAMGAPLKDDYRRGFAYSDCWVDDARLVILNVIDAKERGAAIWKGHELVAARREAGLWHVETRDAAGTRHQHRARALVNAAGPWTDAVMARVGHASNRRALRLVKGSHIVVKRLYEGDHAYTFQASDGRVVFTIPYEGGYSLIGTTDLPFTDDPADVRIGDDEIAYLCRTVSDYFAKPVTPDSVVWTYAGVRPLYDDGEASASAVTRDYVFDLDAPDGEAPLLSIFGGKITTYRRLAEHVMKELSPVMNISKPAWTRDAALPGGDIADADFAGFLDTMRARYPWLAATQCQRLARAYGTRMTRIIGEARAPGDLGRDFGAGLSEAELDYMKRAEWATTAADALWRRSKLGLHMSKAQRAAVAAWFGG